MKRNLRVYVAGPYSKGNIEQNVQNAMDAAEAIWQAGMVPFVPHLTHFYDAYHKHTWDEWLTYDMNWLTCCDVMLRLPGESKGADTEEYVCKATNIPVYKELKILLQDYKKYGRALVEFGIH